MKKKRRMVDGRLVEEEEDRLFRLGRRAVYGRPERPWRFLWRRYGSGADFRARLQAVVRRAPEVMVKVTGGGRGMASIKAHMLYISRRGELAVEDERGAQSVGREAVAALAEEWRLAGAEIPLHSHRREAVHIMFSMPPNTDALAVLAAAREFARTEFSQHKFAMVLHEPKSDPRSNRPHVHLLVRKQGWHGERLNPRKDDLAQWREEFADRLRQRGIAASATRRQARGELQPFMKRRDYHQQQIERKVWSVRPSPRAAATEEEVLKSWHELANALSRSEDAQDRALARETLEFVRQMPTVARRRAALRDKKRTEMAKLPGQLDLELDTPRNHDPMQRSGPERTR